MSPGQAGRLRWRRAARVCWAALCLALHGAPAPAQDEVPFITTPDHVTLAMLELAGVGPQDRVLDLGSGDGRIVITAARRFGARGLGVEIVPELVALSRTHAQKAGVAARVEFRAQDLFTLPAADLAAASVITMYLLPEVNLQLRPRLLALAPGTRIVSHDWDMGDWAPLRTVTLPVPDKAVGRDKLSRLHLWIVPAALQGLWCGKDLELRLVQRLDHVSGEFTRAGLSGPLAVVDGRVQGTRVQLQAPYAGEFDLEPGQNQLRLTRADLGLRGAEGQVLRRAQGERCG